MMKDPFRPNSNEQLIREAQIGFVIIGLLLCVLVYVAFYRLTGRGQRYQEIARNVPVAQSVGAEPYYAQTILEHESDASTGPQQNRPGEKLFEAIAQLAPPIRSTPATRLATRLAPTARQSVTARPTVDAATAAPPTRGSFEPPVVKSRTPRSFVEEIPVARTTSNAVRLPQVKTRNKNTDFENSTFKRPPQPADESLRPISQLPPVIKSEFGAGMQDDLELSLTVENPTKPAETTPSPVDANSFAIQDDRDAEKPQVETASAFEPLPTPEAHSSVAVASFEAENARPEDDTATAFEADGVERYTVQAGDSLWTIAQKSYGDGSWFRALFEHNRVRIGEAGGVVIGFALEIPARQELSRQFPGLSPKTVEAVASHDRQSQPASGLTTTSMTRELDSEMEQRYHLTEDGETLFGIARQRMGQASRYLEIQELNQFRLPQKVNHLTPLKSGVRLLLPE